MNPYAKQLFDAGMAQLGFPPRPEPQQEILARCKRALEFAVQLLDEYDMETQIGYFYIVKTLKDLENQS